MRSVGCFADTGRFVVKFQRPIYGDGGFAAPFLSAVAIHNWGCKETTTAEVEMVFQK